MMNVPCIITTLRIVGTFALIFTKPFTAVFYILYTLTGITDALDGFIARKTNQTSEFGAKLDSVADIFFYVVMIYKISRVLWDKLPVGVWYVVGTMVILRLTSYAVAAIKYKRFASLHTYMNKLTGLCVFMVPYTASLPVFVYHCIIVSGLSVLSTAEELLIHIIKKEYNPHVKTILRIA